MTPQSKETPKILLTPKTRKRKSRLADDLAAFIEGLDLSEDDTVDVVALSLKKLSLLDQFSFSRKPTRAGRRSTSIEERRNVWEFWHKNSVQSTITSRPAKLKVCDKSKIQTDLEFVDTVTVIQQRNRPFYLNHWYITTLTFKELYQRYITSADNKVSLGTFIALKPFYVRSATTKDIEVCCCKTHLHARWSIKALVSCCREQNMTIDSGDVTSYDSFFQFVTKDCQSDETTYIDWKCTPVKSSTCDNISTNWKKLKEEVLRKDDETTCVNMQHFEVTETLLKNGTVVKRLTAVSTRADLKFITTFINGMLNKIIHHRNQLRHYRTLINAFKEHFNTLVIDIDFSENLSVPVKYEPQSLHWSHDQITVHSGLMKYQGEKSYHPYLSADRHHDQHFVQCVLEEMLSDVELDPDTTIVIESDNCASQYKSSAHFDGMQQMSDALGCNIIRVFGIPEHGKGEVDHVGGVAKTAVRREIAAGEFFNSVDEMVDMLKRKFGDNESPKYVFKLISEKKILEKRELSKLKVYPTIKGSNKFQVMVFKPNQSQFAAAPRLCLCDECKINYGSCPIFQKYDLSTVSLKETILRSNQEEVPLETTQTGHEFLLPNTVCALAAEKKSPDTVWFVEIEEEAIAANDLIDDYGVTVPEGNRYLRGSYLEKESDNKRELKFKKMKKTTFFYPESVVYPYVNVTKKKELYIISREDFFDIITYVQHYGMSAI